MTAGAGFEIKIDTKKAEAQLREVGAALRTDVLLRLIGERLKLFVAEAFRTQGGSTGHAWRLLRPNTLANPKRGRGAQVLRNTGALHQSFVAEVGSDRVTVGSNKFYAGFHQFGTRPYEIRPVNKRALFFWTVKGNAAPYMGKGNTFARVVRHPGLPARPMLPDESQTRMLAEQTLRGYVDRVLERRRGKA